MGIPGQLFFVAFLLSNLIYLGNICYMKLFKYSHCHSLWYLFLSLFSFFLISYPDTNQVWLNFMLWFLHFLWLVDNLFLWISGVLFSLSCLTYLNILLLHLHLLVYFLDLFIYFVIYLFGHLFLWSFNYLLIYLFIYSPICLI